MIDGVESGWGLFVRDDGTYYQGEMRDGTNNQWLYNTRFFEGKSATYNEVDYWYGEHPPVVQYITRGGGAF